MNEYKCNFDLEDRTEEYSKQILELSKLLEKNLENNIFRKQVVRCGTSVGANYIEANEALSEKDFVYRIKICRKEAKETNYWLTLIKHSNDSSELLKKIYVIMDETNQLIKIFSTIIQKKEDKMNKEQN